MDSRIRAIAIENQRLAQALEFSQEDLALNKAGSISDRQKEVVAQIMRWRYGSRSCAILVFLISLGVLWVVGFSLLREEMITPASQNQLSIIYTSWLAVGGVIVAAFLSFLWIDRSRANDLRQGNVKTVEGPAALDIRELKGARLYGVKAYYVSVGGIEFQLADKKQYEAFEAGRAYRFYYLKNPPTHTILSVESI